MVTAFNFKASFCFLFGLVFHSLGCPSNETFSLLFEREDINWGELFLLFSCSLDLVRLNRVLVSLYLGSCASSFNMSYP